MLYEIPYIQRTDKSDPSTEVKSCKHCLAWQQTGRQCTIQTHLECDCPKCQGLCNHD